MRRVGPKTPAAAQAGLEQFFGRGFGIVKMSNAAVELQLVNSIEDLFEFWRGLETHFDKVPAHQNRFRCLFFDLQLAHFLDEPFLRFGTKVFLRWKPVRIAAEAVGFRDTIKKVGLYFSREPSKCT